MNPKTRQFFGPIDISQIDQHWPRHDLLHSIEIQCPELLPFRHHDEGVRILGTRIGAIAVIDIVYHQLRLLHAGRIVGADPCAKIAQSSD